MPQHSLDPVDSVVMLTWSNWHEEPRSNRYHFATRFAERWPVYFVQPNGTDDTVKFSDIDGHAIKIVQIAGDYGPRQANRLAAALRSKGVHHPIVWVYNGFFSDAISRLSPAVTVYHATEDYVAPDSELLAVSGDVVVAVQKALSQSDVIVAVSEGVAESYRLRGANRRPVVVVPNGCDFEFWKATNAWQHEAPTDGEKIALYQGGVNGRLDYSLLQSVARKMQDWQFWFCGRSSHGGAGWEMLQLEPNVRHFGELDSNGIARLARKAKVGLIPFKQDGLMRRSLPLKAYEYLACGLPVVTIPIDALDGKPELFHFASTAETFSEGIAAVGETRSDPEALDKRLVGAERACYSRRFIDVVNVLDQTASRKRRASPPPLNVLVLYDEGSTHVGTLLEHLESFKKYSRHTVHYYPATSPDQPAIGKERGVSFDHYDALIIHYSVRVSLDWHLAPAVASRIANYRGVKLLFIQDEYDTTEIARQWIERLGVTAVFTNVPDEGLETIYPRERFGGVDFIPTMTGYVPEDPAIDECALPIRAREVMIGYRGRSLPHNYGALGHEKYVIGVEVKRFAEERGLKVDIEVDTSRRINGLDWYRFLGSVRATLGTESGSNVFDFDGRLLKLANKNADMPFKVFAEKFLKDHEGLVQMNQISPKIFESIRLRTALILFEGSYSGVIEPGRHFIPLRKDFSNIDEVFRDLNDVGLIEEMTDRAYRDIIDGGGYSYETFMAGVDAYIDSKVGGKRRACLISLPVIVSFGSENFDISLPGASGSFITDTPIGAGLGREQMQAVLAAIGSKRVAVAPVLQKETVKRAWRMLPPVARAELSRRIRAYAGDESKPGLGPKVVRSVWTRLRRLIRDR
jgi:glycosyltransferase involved in cell wall biosynthesis